jgi:hypothetical protein
VLLIQFTQFLEVWRERREEKRIRERGRRADISYIFFLASLDVEKQRGWRGE